MEMVRQTGAALRGALHWWLGELAGMVPARLRQRLQRRARSLVVVPRGQDLQIHLQSGDQSESLGLVETANRSSDEVRQIVSTMLSGDRFRRADVVLRVPADEVLSRSLELPTGAEDDLRQALRFQIDRLTPFSADEVYFDHIVRDRDIAAKRMTVELFVAPRERIAEAVERLREVHLPPAAIDIANGRDGLATMLDPKTGGPASRRTGAVSLANVALIVAVSLLAAAAVYVPLAQQQRERTLLETRVTAIKADAAEAASMRDELERLLQQDSFLLDRKRDSISVVEVLDELSRALPDDTWVLEFRVRDGEIRLLGYSSSASALVGLLDSSSAFKTPRFVSPVTQDQRSGKERFHIAFKIEEGGES